MLKFFKLHDQEGLATLVTLFIMIMLTLIGLAAIMVSNDEVQIASNEANEMAAFYAAEAGLERAAAAIQDQYVTTGAPPTVMPTGSEAIDGGLFAYNSSDNGPAVQSALAHGTLAGLHALIKTYAITSTGTSTKDNSAVSLSMEFQAALVPLFQFAVFYDNDLEIAPGPDMTLLGRVHSNSNLWLQAGANLNMDSYVTCAGDLLHGRKGPGGVTSGDIFIKDTEGSYQNMKNTDGSFLSSVNPNWYADASNRWGGRVQDAAFGQQDLNLPLNNSGDPHKIIERYNGGANPDSYETRAEARIINGRYYARMGGVWTDVTASLPAGTITTGSFYDHRENATVNATDVDMNLLKSSIYFPSNGVIYASDQSGGSFNALRLKNAGDIGHPLSIFCENPMYVQGDYNNVNKQPAALCADAVTFLSNNWNDANSWSSDLQNDRKATATECYASIMTGNIETTSSDYNGGLENLPRFLEDWSPDGSQVTFKWSGSMVNLWNAHQANGDWLYGTPNYEAPDRDWSYDIDLDDPAKLPPATPMLRVFNRLGWRQMDVAHQTDQYMDSTAVVN